MSLKTPPKHEEKAASRPHPIKADSVHEVAQPFPSILTSLALRNPAAILQLQRTIGNRATIQLLRSDAPVGTIQRKRNTKTDDKTLVKLFGNNVPSDILAGKVTEDEQGKAIWEHLQRHYAKTLENGTRYWNQLSDAIADYKAGHQKKQDVVSTNTEKRRGYDERFAANYISGSNPVANEEGKYEVSSEGFDTDSTDAEERIEKEPKSANYYNAFDVKKGTIEAKANWNKEIDRNTGEVSEWYDEAAKAGKGLSNSEILWQQFKLAANQHHNQDPNKVSAAQKAINMIRRVHITQAATSEVVYMAQEDGDDWSTANKQWQPGQEEFLAVLGTPNVLSSAHFLKDHLDEIEKDIEKITVISTKGSDKDIQIDFKDI